MPASTLWSGCTGVLPFRLIPFRLIFTVSFRVIVYLGLGIGLVSGLGELGLGEMGQNRMHQLQSGYYSAIIYNKKLSYCCDSRSYCMQYFNAIHCEHNISTSE